MHADVVVFPELAVTGYPPEDLLLHPSFIAEVEQGIARLAALTAGCDLALLCNQSIGEGAALDELLAGFAAAQRSGAWQPDAASETRRRALLPRGPALEWDALVASSGYVQARQTLLDAVHCP